MKLLPKLTLINLLCLTAFSAGADDYNNTYNQQTSTNTGTLVQYLQNLGGFLGYDITQKPPTPPTTISLNLISVSTIQLAQTYLYSTFLGAIPVDAVNEALAQIVPSTVQGSSTLNQLANSTFKNQNYSSPSTTGGTASVSPLMDQQTYQPDPVSQSVLNILGTPDYSFCMSYEGDSWNQNCPLMYQNKVMANVIGTLPKTYEFFGYNYNQQFISQLNSNSLMGPMLYSTDNPPSSTGSTVPNQQAPGLTAQNQVQQAANFIRYASGAVSPATLPKLKAYDTLYNEAVPPQNAPNSIPVNTQMQAQAILNTYFTNLRIYAAQSSVGLGNLYYLMSKRLPQKQSNDNSIVTSQSMSEFNMATWRLFNIANPTTPNQQWINQINAASSATVQKEIATLLAEINYQMYLDRQLQERILLTNTIMLIQNTKASQPSPDFAAQSSAAGN